VREESIDQNKVPFALGVCYYPEQWPRDRWADYARQMRELGLTYVRIAEFAWSRMEPAPDVWNWGWLDEAIETLAAEDLKVVLCTPTATPPAWLVRQHPDILGWDAQGRVRDFGSRRHYDFASPVYRAQSRRITTAIAARYGEHPAVVGWQTDNEFGCHETTRSYGPASRDAFRRWLAERYETCDAWNEAWGTIFWSQEYSDWSQVEPPNLTVTEPNPSHVLDYARFASDQIASFQEEQVEILRRLSPGRWITHNFMIFFDEFDHYRVAECLDFVSWDSYPTGMLERSWLPDDVKTRFARTGHPDLISFNHDLYRGLKPGRGFWVMEQQPGQVNWAASNPLPAVGAVPLWTAQANAHGCDVVSYFRWRAATMAQELMHAGLLRHDETLDRGGEEIAALRPDTFPTGPVRASVVLLHDYESAWAYDQQPHAAEARYWRQVMLFYTALRQLGVDVEIRHADADLAGYRLVVVPAIHLVGEERAARFRDVAGRTVMLFGPRTGFRTPTGRAHENGQPGPLADVLGWKLLNFDALRPGLVGHVGDHPVEIWAESYRLLGADALFAYSEGPLAGQTAVARHGNAVTIGAWSPSLIAAVLRDLLVEVGVPVVPVPEGVHVARRNGIETWLNFRQVPVTLADDVRLAPVSFQHRPSPVADE
jgi:beta-galactosidase